MGSPSLYHTAIFTVTKSGSSRHKQGRGGEGRGDRMRAGMEAGGGVGELGERKNLPIFPSVVYVPY